MEEKDVFYAIEEEQVQPADTNEQQTEQQIEVQVADPATGEQVQQQETQTQESGKIKIEGVGEFTPEEIKEWKQGYMRQSDYTRKTQELARMRKEAVHPVPFQAMQQAIATPSQPQQFAYPYEELSQRISQMEQSTADRELDIKITELKTKYPDFDEVKVLNEAYQRGVTDLEFVYKATRQDVQTSNVETLKAQITQQILAELGANKDKTATIINTSNQQPKSTVKLTAQQEALAREFGMSAEEYAKYSN